MSDCLPSQDIRGVVSPLDQYHLLHRHQDPHDLQHSASSLHSAPHDQSSLLAFHGPPQLDQQDITFSHQIPQSHHHIDSMANEYLLTVLPSPTDLSSPAALLMEGVISTAVDTSPVNPMVAAAAAAAAAAVTLGGPVHDTNAMDEDGGVDELALYTYIPYKQEDDDIDSVVADPSMDLHDPMLVDTEDSVVVAAADHASPLSTTDSLFDTLRATSSSPEPPSTTAASTTPTAIPTTTTTTHISLPRLTIETSVITRSSNPAAATATSATGATSQPEKKDLQWLSAADDTHEDGMENVDAIGASALLASPSSSGSATPELLSPALSPFSGSSLCSSGLTSPLSPRADDSLLGPSSKPEDHHSIQTDTINDDTIIDIATPVSTVQTPPSPPMTMPASPVTRPLTNSMRSKTRKISENEHMESSDECLAPKKKRKTSHAQHNDNNSNNSSNTTTTTTTTAATQANIEDSDVDMIKSAMTDVQRPPSPLSLESPDAMIKEEHTDSVKDEPVVKIEADEARLFLSPSPSATSSSGPTTTHKRPWTEAEEKLLLELVDRQMPIKEIAHTLSRTVHSVRSRRQVLTDPGFVKGHGHSQPRRSKPDPSSKLPTYSQMAFLSLARLPSLQGTLNDVAAMVEQLFSPHLNRIPRTGHKNLQIWRAQISDALAHEKGHPRPRFESFGVKRGRQWVYRLTEFGRGVMEAMAEKGGIDAICEDLLRCNGLDQQQRLALQGDGTGSTPAGIGRAPEVAIKIEPGTTGDKITTTSSKSSKGSKRSGSSSSSSSSSSSTAKTSGDKENSQRPDPSKAIADAMAAMSAALAEMSAVEDEKEAAALAAANNGVPVAEKPARGRGRAAAR
ncbi:hypothetical protein DFQ27_002658 [Actinomortierella ambigua]|uniref:Uncharacterized protein n=1 Tax=Actinomortierella ambigua TaxID=1343610 RepID=A0A9P6QM86_9FUNG|nr:hypothetical protein DFQ27_002658 [Actinomortierella ambigua]